MRRTVRTIGRVTTIYNSEQLMKAKLKASKVEDWLALDWTQSGFDLVCDHCTGREHFKLPIPAKEAVPAILAFRKEHKKCKKKKAKV